MLNFLKKKKQSNQTELFAVVSGALKPITEVQDQVFSTKMMGDGFAIHPEADEIFAPGTGVVTSVFPTKHAITFLLSNGAEVLVHMGLDTVELAGATFEVLVKEGDQVDAQTQIANMNRKAIKDGGYQTEVIVVVTNSDGYQMPEIQTIGVTAKTTLGELKQK